MAKYGNRKVSMEIAGNKVTFDSVVERDRYLHLALLEKAGEIQNLELQPEYVLQAGFRRNGVAWRAEKYRGDFRYEKDGVIHVEDAKGFKTDVYKSKVKRLLFLYPELVFIEVFRKQKQWSFVTL